MREFPSDQEKMEIRERTREAYSHIDDDLILDFFIVFSRFEYALKEAGYIRSSKAEVNWCDFIEKIETDFSLGPLGNPKNMDLFKEFKTQTICEDKLDWRDFKFNEDNSNANNVVNVIRTIRNNLFHGGKTSEFCSGLNKSRDEELMKYALKYIEILINSESNVRNHFYDTVT